MRSNLRKLDLLDRQLYYSIKGMVKESDEALEKLLIERPNDHKVLYNQAFRQLRDGNIKDGMINLNKGRVVGVFGSPPLNTDKEVIMDVSKAKGLTILVNLEGGIGDNILGLKFAKELSKQNKIIAIGPKSLDRLVNSQNYIYKYYNSFSNNINFDCWYPSLASELVFGYTDYNQIPIKPFIKIKSRGKIKKSIGIKFRGNKEFDHDKYRSPKPEKIIEMLEPLKDKFKLYSLEVEDDIELPDWIIKPEPFKDWYDTACFIKKLDTVISTCTAVAHLSAGMGKRTLVMVPVLPYWIWACPNIIDGYDRTWYYNNTYLFRQEIFGDWDLPLNNIVCMLLD
jgi:hypothetical protein